MAFNLNPEEIHIHSVADVEAALVGNPPPQPNERQFTIFGDTPLGNIDSLRLITQPGRSGFLLRNPQMLNSKDKVKVALTEGMDAMLAGLLAPTNAQIADIDICIGVMERRLNLPDAAIPYEGLRFSRRGRHVGFVLYPRSQFDPTALYDDILDENLASHTEPTAAAQARFRAQDIQSTRAVWAKNLYLLRRVKAMLSDHHRTVTTEFQKEKVETMRENTVMGIGYADTRFLHSSNQMPAFPADLPEVAVDRNPN